MVNLIYNLLYFNVLSLDTYHLFKNNGEDNKTDYKSQLEEYSSKFINNNSFIGFEDDIINFFEQKSFSSLSILTNNITPEFDHESMFKLNENHMNKQWLNTSDGN